MANRIALGIEYDGSRFLGWQTQPGGGTVQDALEAALSGIADAPAGVTCAGRTDRGVHARAQVVHFDTDAERPDSAWVRGVNGMLPESMAVLWSQRVSGDFHARYSARSRTYRYVLINRPVRPALEARYAGWYHAPLELDAMRAAAGYLLGEHDFSAFRAAECQAKSPVRTLHAIGIARSGERIEFTMRANAWLQHMVRNIVGTLVYVGKGKHPPQWTKKLLDSRDRARAAPTFGPEGLYLEAVGYEPRWNIPDAVSQATVLPVES
jgi:tRNA pseudouridine38-40 synthase